MNHTDAHPVVTPETARALAEADRAAASLEAVKTAGTRITRTVEQLTALTTGVIGELAFTTTHRSA